MVTVMNSTMSPTMEVSLAGYIFRLSIMCFCVLLLTKGAGVPSAKKRCVYRGEAVKLFSDIGGQYEEGSMYAENETYIASWSMKDDNIKIDYINPNYNGRIHIDGNRNIWFLGVERKDAGKYFFKSGVDIKQLDVELTVLEELTEVQLQECPNNCPDFSKKDFGISHHTTTAQSKKDDTEGYVTAEQILQLRVNHPQEFLKEPCGSSNSLTIGLLSAILFFVILNTGLAGLANKNDIKNGWIWVKHWILERLPCQHRIPEHLSRSEENTVVSIVPEETDYLLRTEPNEDSTAEVLHGNLTEDQIGELIKKWLGLYLGLFMKKYLETLTEDQVQKWLNDHPDFMEKYLENPALVYTYIREWATE